MIFIDDNGNTITSGDLFALTKQAISFFSSDILGDISINFTIDANSQNKKTLGYFGPQMINQVAWVKQPFNRIYNGNIIDRGYIVIQSEEDGLLNCFYTSGNSNWIQSLNGLINNLDFTGITNGKDYRVKWDSTIAFTTNINFTNGIIFPFIDWGSNFLWGANDYKFSKYIYDQIVDSSGDYLGYPFIQFYPCFYLNSLVVEICKQNGIKLSGNILNDNIYKSLIITPYKGDFKKCINTDHIVVLSGSTQNFAGGLGVEQKYTSFIIRNNADNLFSLTTNKYTSNAKTSISLTFSGTGDASTFLVIYKNGIGFRTGGIGNDITTDLDYSINNGDIFEFYVKNSVTNPFNISLAITIQDLNSQYNLVSPSDFLPSLTCIDIIKFIYLYFGCSIYYDVFSKTLNCNIIEKFDQSLSLDWSNYYISHRSEYTVDQAENNYFSWESTSNDDSYIKNYNSQNKIDFGGGNIETGNTLLAENNFDTLPFAASYSSSEKNGIFNPYIPLVKLEDIGDPVQFSAIVSVTASISSFNAPPVSATPQPVNYYKHEILRITDLHGSNLGYFLSSRHNTSVYNVQIYMKFISSFQGFIYKQKISFNNINSRILSVKTNSLFSEICTTTTTYYNGSSDINFSSIIPAVFTKQKALLPIDSWKNNLAIDNISGNNDSTIKELYFNKISRIFNNPNIRCQMLLPQAVFQSFDFSNFIYLKTEHLTGYFFVKSIVNYQDSDTPVEVNLYML